MAVYFALPFVFACAANTVKTVAEVHDPSIPPPPVVLVYDPLFHDPAVRQPNNNVVTVGSLLKTTDDRYPGGDLGKHTAHVFADELVTSISKIGMRATHADRNTPIPEHAVVIVGQLVDAKKGSNATRLVVGFGAGASRVDMRVFVYEVGDKPVELLELQSHADSGKLPGTAIVFGAGAAATGGVTIVGGVGALAGGGIKTYRYSVEQLAKRSARHTTEYMSRYFAQQRWIAQSNVKKHSPVSHVLDVW